MVSRLFSELVALVAPPACASCRAPLLAGDELLCAGCRAGLPWLEEAVCPRCGLPLPCGRRCPAVRAAFERAWAPMAYSATARELVAALKFHGALPVAGLMAAPMAAGAPAGLLDDATLVPVPLHPARRRRRGFNQAERLAGALGARTGRPVSACLHRRGAPTRQLGAGRAQRLTNARIELQLRGPPPPMAVLVDDVHTTGATFDACARALREAGARHVAAIAYARTLDARHRS